MIKILLTGGNGFIGKNIFEGLGIKYKFYLPNHLELDLLDEVKVKNYLSQHKFDVVIHTANIGGNRKTAHLTNIVPNNLRMFFNIARCHNLFGKMIFLGSGAEYDKRQNITHIQESDFDKSVPIDDYGFYKYTCSKYIELADNIINLRIFGMFGPYEDTEIRFISNSICKVIYNLPINIYQNVKFDYVYVKDFIKIIDYFINNNGKYKFYNIGTGISRDLNSIARDIIDISGKKISIKIEKKGWNKEYTCDNKRLITELTNFKFTDFHQSILDLYQWYQIHQKKFPKKNFITK